MGVHVDSLLGTHLALARTLFSGLHTTTNFVARTKVCQ